MVCSKLIQTLFNSEPKVLKAAMRCYAAIFSLDNVSENQFTKYLSNSMPLSIDEGTKGKILRSVEMRAKMQPPPKLGSGGLLVYEPEISDFLNSDDLNALRVVARDRSTNESLSSCKEVMKPPQRSSPWRAALRRTRQARLGYAHHFSALQEFQKATQSHLNTRTAATNATDGKQFPLISTLEDNSRISVPAGDARSNSYAHIAEKRRLTSNEMRSRERPLFLESQEKRSILERKQNGLRRCYSALSLEEKEGESSTSFSQLPSGWTLCETEFHS
ncbi:hypothetical protein TcWFU_007938 [Taenia crassiceps]|uniref:Uncharacterized protein n=1 Tax=Taenia crassiceps TaxID=6207 RepID=A0ABR4QSR9_9CEST